MTDPKKPLSFDPLEHLPSLRAPRVPKFDPKADTIPAPPQFPESGEHHLRDSESFLAETTSTETPSTKELLKQTLIAAQHAANEAVATRTEVQGLRKDFERLDKRVTSLELSQRWVPMLIGIVAIALSVWVAFELQTLRAQLQLLQRVTYHDPEAAAPTARQ